MAAPDLSVTVPLMRLLVCAPAVPGKRRRGSRASPARREGKWQIFEIRRWLFTMKPPKFENSQYEGSGRGLTHVHQRGTTAREAEHDHSSRNPSVLDPTAKPP